MTENEANTILKAEIVHHPECSIFAEALGLAIQALEIIKKLSDRKMTTEVLENYMQFEDECVEKGFTFKSMIEAREKQIPKKTIPIDYEKYMNTVKNALFLKGAYWCPNCKHVVKCGTYCSDCGQKLDWSDEE